VPDFIAKQWLPENLCRSCEGRGLDDVLADLARRATGEVDRIRRRVPKASDRRLSSAFAG
jgi:hypothetical protein